MEEDFEFDFSEDPRFSVERYEEMIRNQDQYFFDAQAFESIIEYYVEKLPSSLSSRHNDI